MVEFTVREASWLFTPGAYASGSPEVWAPLGLSSGRRLTLPARLRT